MEDLILYYRPTCPFCLKVLDFLENNNIKLTLKDVSQEPSNKHDLISIGGKSQVPCLIISGKAIYESEDIINWLQTKIKS